MNHYHKWFSLFFSVFVLSGAQAMVVPEFMDNYPTASVPHLSDKADYAKTVEAKLDNWERTIVTLKKQAAVTTNTNRQRTLEQTAADLSVQCDRAKADLNRLYEAKGDFWQNYQGLLEARLDAMTQRYHRVFAE